MYKLMCFDVDGTLAPVNGPIASSTLERLKLLQGAGLELMLISGKPTAYLAGIVRQSGLGGVMVAGGNGEVLASSHGYPPRFVINSPVDGGLLEFFGRLKGVIRGRFGDRVWFQPNEMQLTVFHYEDRAVEVELMGLIAAGVSEAGFGASVKVYQHFDCIDVLPLSISKGNMVEMVCEKRGIALADVISVGDSLNDVSMFGVTGLSLGIGTAEGIAVSRRFEGIDEALDYVLGACV